jgi:UDP:flavonoid glycosyltransferase YjiC (YdhE family)
VRIAIVCNDTRGGVQPYVALALGLRRDGHAVSAVAPGDLAPMFGAAGIAVTPLSGSIEALVRTAGDAIERGTIASMRFATRMMPAWFHAWTRETLAGCADADVLTGGFGGMAVGLSVAEKLGKPFIETHLHPVGVPTDAYPGVLLAGTPAWLGSAAMRLSHTLSEWLTWAPLNRAMVSARRDVLGLGGRPRRRTDSTQPVLYGFSRHVVPMPGDPGRARHVTGYWTLPAAPDWRPPADLAAFVARDGPVVSIGFGSMTSRDPAALTALVLAAARSAGVRVVLLGGWGALGHAGALPGDDGRGAGDVIRADAVPHDWLFPRVTAVVHHGGAGTTGAALGAGVPAIVVPFTMDQPFWALRVATLGVGPPPIPRTHLTRDRLAAALRRTVDDAPMQARAAALGALIRAEDGVAQAVAHFRPGASS